MPCYIPNSSALVSPTKLNNMLSRRTKALLISLIIFLSAILLITFISNHTQRSSDESHDQHIRMATSSCLGTRYPKLCFSTLLTSKGIKCQALPDIVTSTIDQALTEVKRARLKVRRYETRVLVQESKQPLDSRDGRAIDDCLELLDETASELETSFTYISSKERTLDAKAQLSAAMTNLYTCLDGFAHSKNQSIRDDFKGNLYKISHHISNTLAMVSKLPESDHNPSDHLKPSYGMINRNGFPKWMNQKDVMLFQTTNTTSNVSTIRYDLIVAKDGSGNFTTINEALAIAPNSSRTRFVIYIKAGEYFEYVEVVKKKMNIMFLGDGIGKTVIKGNRSLVDGWTTFQSATLAVAGQGFVAIGITVENYAGAIKFQAVALRSSSDHSAFYNCSFIGYQDTLYVHRLRQFYRECDIYGTVDFIFGDASVVFQKCNLYARRPLQKYNQKNIFTAQGRKDPLQISGISIMESNIGPADELIPVKSLFKTYLGRPWKEYSRTVIMRCNISDVVEAAGWLEWNETFALNTLYYGEYMNIGAGANTSGRVTWPGFKVITNETEAAQFTVGSFILGNEWLNSTGIPYYLNLTA